MASLAARVRISAHETVDGQNFSTSSFILSMISKPRSEFRFGGAFFSPFILSVSSRSTEASHPYKHTHTHKTKINRFDTI